MTTRNLQSLFSPRSVALIGASERPASLGSVLLRNLLQGGFKGPIWPVNPKRSTVLGLTAWPDLAAVPEAPELAIICTPASTVVELIQELGERGTRAAIVISAGLKQPWAIDPSRSIEQAMLEAARPHLLRILGPNCLGALVPGVGLNASFAPAQALPGTLAFVSQSGALATAMLDWAAERGIGFSHFVSLGDSADVDFGDMLDYLATDGQTQAILLYMESVRQARKFMSAARAAARNKPVILVKAGRAPEGARAAASHTGALAGADGVFDAAVRRSGMLRVDTLEALFDAAQTLAHGRGGRAPSLAHLPQGRLLILTNGGGAGVLAADALSLGGGRLATLQASTLAALDACLPATWSHGNPVDIIGDAPVQRYVDALQVVLAAEEVDGVLFMHAPTAVVPAEEIARACLPLLTAANKPTLTSWVGGLAVASARRLSHEAGLPSHDTPERAVNAWLQMLNYARNQRALQQLVRSQPPEQSSGRAQAQTLIAQARKEGRAWLGDTATLALLQAYGLPAVKTERCDSAEQAGLAAERIGYPVALKLISPQVVHKSDVGGVALNLRSRGDVHAAAEKMRKQLAEKLPSAQLSGYTVQAMADRPAALELIVGMHSDPVFGPVLLLGEGGVQVELSARHALALPPLDAELADELIERSGLLPLLAGFRGRPACDTAALVDSLLKLSTLATELSDLVELDINPLLIDEKGVLAVDARARLRPPEQAAVVPAILPYPAELEETLMLSGQPLLIRPIRPSDGLALQQFYAQASPQDLRLRFFAARREVPLSELARYSQIDYDREMTFVALSDGVAPAGLCAEVRAVCDPDKRKAEFSLLVSTEWQRQGLGEHLLRKMMDYLRGQGTVELMGLSLAENQVMLQLARRLGFAIEPLPQDATMVMRLVLGLGEASSHATASGNAA
ncbi:MAG: bifunctional acetate--CoA ligase family protein/GNAT family N-acetyltransferase [Betaproteobacteria bacterium]